MRLIVGLGNPGPAYCGTRHNMGFIAADQLAGHNNMSLSKTGFKAAYGIGYVGGHKTIIAKPLTYMNLSGEAVAAIAAHYNITPAHITVIHDDMDIAYGELRIKVRGGAAGHRGVKSILQHLDASHCTRIRLGIGKPHPPIAPVDYVLQNFDYIEKNYIKEVIRKTACCISVLYTDGPQAAMNIFHRSGE